MEGVTLLQAVIRADGGHPLPCVVSLVPPGIHPIPASRRGNGHEGMHVVNGPVTSPHGKNPVPCVVSLFVREAEKRVIAVSPGRREEHEL